MNSISRREAIKTAALAGAALSLGSLTPALLAQPATAARRRVLRVAHLTDIHVQPELRASEGMAACLRAVNSLDDKPDLIITGGDQIMDSFATSHERARLQWDIWKSALKDSSVPAVHTLGNHDIWGWNKDKSGASGQEAQYGKAWACEMFGREKTYTSFDRGGWHIILLDSIQPDGNGYIGQLDEEQFAWLEQDLKATRAPVMIVSHIPIFTVCVYSHGRRDDGKTWRVPGSLMHIDAHRLRKLFLQNPHVKLCLSGHIHERDRVDFNGVTYLCNGAVSGAWWKGRHQECDEGYALVNLYSDGGFDHEYRTYGWVAKK